MSRRITILKELRRNQLQAILDMFSEREMPLTTKIAILTMYDCGYNNRQGALICNLAKSTVNNAIRKIERVYELIQHNFMDL
ncbi:hypothetical protein [Photobacterium damselae]|uniref:hypothetical protein n=1 Tax=Photobacterium damselae TaxID=38293 RepID=UPI004067ECB7